MKKVLLFLSIMLGVKAVYAENESEFFSYSGRFRTRYETKQNFDLIYSRPDVQPGRSDNDDNYFLSQFRLNLKFRPSEYLEGHVTLQDARVFGSHQYDIEDRDRQGRQSLQDEFDVYEAYLTLKVPNTSWKALVGRQEMDFGDGRLIGSNRWRNVGKPYDALRLIYSKDDFQLDLFAANVPTVDSNAWNHTDEDDDLLGAYATFKNLSCGSVDLYLLHRDSEELNRDIYTAGTLLKGEEGPLDWRFEGAYQWGSSEDLVAPSLVGESLDHKAWAISSEIGWSHKDHALKPRWALAYDFATGDADPNDGEDNTFDNLFPRTHSIHGFMDFVSWKNLHDPHVKFSWQQSKKLKIGTEWHFFFLDEEDTDAWYNNSQTVFRNSGGRDVSSFAGHELDIRATYKATENLEIDLGYGHYFAGDYAADTAPAGGGGDDADFAYLQATWKF
jgi:hypothetical protein